MNPLHEAAKNGDINKVRGLLETGASDINKKDDEVDILRPTPLHNAAGGGHSDVVALLIQHGADPCSTDTWSRTPLHYAAEGGHRDVAALLIQHGADPCSTDCTCITPLHYAAEGGHSDVAALLIQHGADPCSTDSWGRTPLHNAAEGGHSDVVDRLIQHGADPCSKNREGNTPLHKAAWGGHRDVAALLIQHGADPCSTDEQKRTPLHNAADRGQSDVAALLIQRGADPRSTDGEGRTALHLAAWGGHSDVAALLIQKGADPCSRGRWGRTPLHEAAVSGHSDVAAVLIKHEADPCSTDENGRTPLHDAALHGNSGVAFLLIQQGADLCSRDNLYGSTPLHYAAQGGHSNVAALLIQRGADPRNEDSRGERPSGTIQRRNQELATRLKKFENDQVQNFIFVLTLEHVAATMNIVEANTLFKEDMRCHSLNERHNKLEMLRNWAQSYGLTTIQKLKARLADAGCQNLAVAAEKHYAGIVKEIMDMSPYCYETFCQDPMSQRHMITSAGCSTEQRCEISMETDSYQYDAYLAHHSDDEEVVDEVRGQFESNRVCCCEPPLPGSVKIQSMCESVEITRRTVSIFFKTSLGSEPFKVTSNVAFGVAEKGKEGVMIPVTTDVDPKSLPPPCDTMQCIHFQSHDFIPKLADVIKGPTDAPLYGQLRNENENMKREIAALRQQLEDSTALNRRLQAEVMTADAPRQFVCEPNKLYRLGHSSMETDSYQCDVYLAHDSDDEEVVDEVRGKLEFSGVRCSEPALAGTSIIKSDNDPVKTAKRTVPFFSKNSLESKLFMMTCDVALIEANERKEDVMIPVTIDVDPKSLPPPYGTLNCIPYKSQDFIQKLIDAIKGPTDAPFYGQLRDENENLKMELAALRQQLEDSTSLNRRVQAELDAAAALRQFVCESEGT